MLMLSGHLMAVNVAREKMLSELGLTDDCKKATQLMQIGGLNSLQYLYLKRIDFSCTLKQYDRKSEAAKERARDFYKSYNETVKLEFSGNNDYSCDLIQKTMIGGLDPDINEMLTKAYLRSIEKDPQYCYSSDEHPYEERVVFERFYTQIASAYYSNGMKGEGERILNELRELPHQYLAGIDDAQERYERSYSRWEDKQKALKEKAQSIGITNIEDSTKENVKEEIATTEPNTEKQIEPNTASAVTKLESIFKQYGIFILAFLIFFGMYLYSRRKTKK